MISLLLTCYSRVRVQNRMSPCYIIVFPYLGRKESDSHNKRVVEFGKCHMVRPASRNVINRSNTKSMPKCVFNWHRWCLLLGYVAMDV